MLLGAIKVYSQSFSLISLLDLKIFNWINQFAGQKIWLDVLGIFFARYFPVLVVLGLFLFCFKNFRRYRLMVVVALGTAIFARFPIVTLFHHFLPRLRPFVEHNVNLLINYSPHRYGFPSGHTTFFFALSTIVFLYLKEMNISSRMQKGVATGFFLSSFLIGLARVFVGVHYPFDILAGIVVGIFTGWMIFWLISLIKKKSRNQS